MIFLVAILCSFNALAFEIGDIWIVPKINSHSYGLSVDQDSTETVYEPNNNAAFGGSIITKWITLSGTLPAKARDERVKTKSLDLSLSYELERWSFSTYYQKYKGLVVDKNDLGLEEVRSDMETFHYGARAFWATNKDYRVDKAISLLYKEPGHSWSFFIAAHYDKGHISGDNYIIDQPIPGLEVLNNNEKLEFEFIGLGGGLGYLYANDSLFFQTHFLFTMGPQDVKFKPTGFEDSVIANNVDLRIILGRNSKQNIFGLLVDAMSHSTTVEEVNDFATVMRTISIYYGRKF